MSSSPEIAQEKKADLAHLVGLCLLLLGLYLPQLLLGQTAVDAPNKMDVTLQWWPGRMVANAAYRQGDFPLWNPDLFFGTPLLAYAHGSLLYPPCVLLFTALNYFTAATLLILFHALLGALGCYFFLRGLGISGRASFLAAVVWSQAGLWFHLINQFSNLMTTAYLPWLLLALLRLHLSAQAKDFLLLVGLCALAVLAGDTEGAVYIFMLCGLVLLLYFPFRDRSGLFRTFFLFGAALAGAFLLVAALSFPLLEFSHLSVRSPSSPLAVKFMPQIQGVLKFLPQLLAPFEYYRELKRYSDYNHGLSPFYQGLLPLVLAVMATARCREDRENRCWLIILLCLLAYLWVMSLESLSPLTSRLPVLGRLSSRGRMLEEVQFVVLILFARELDRGEKTWMLEPRRWSRLLFLLAVLVLLSAKFTVAPIARLVFGVAMLVTAGLGFELARRGEEQANLEKLKQWSHGLLTLLVLLDVTLLAYFCVPRTPVSAFKLEAVAEKTLNQVEPTSRFQPMYQLFESPPSENPSFPLPDLNGAILAYTPLHSPIGFMRLPLARSFYFLSLANPGVLRQLSTIFAPGPASFLNMDIAAMTNPDFLSPQYLKLMNLAAVRYYVSRDLSLKFSETYPLLTPNAFPHGQWGKGSLQALKVRGQGLSRSFTTSLPFHAEFESALYPESSLSVELAGPPGLPVRVKLFGSATPPAPNLSAEAHLLLSPSGQEVKLPLEGTPGTTYYLLLDFEGQGEMTVSKAAMLRPGMPLKLIASGEVDIYENREALPRAFILHQVRVIPQLKELAATLLDEKIDLSRTLLLEQPDPSVEIIQRASLPPPPLRQEPVWLEHKPQTVKARCSLHAPGYLFLSDSYAPGWRAFEGSREHRVLKANLAFRAVFLSPGEHEIIFTYQPLSFRVGLYVTLAALATFLAFTILSSGAPRTQPLKQESEGK